MTEFAILKLTPELKQQLQVEAFNEGIVEAQRWLRQTADKYHWTDGVSGDCLRELISDLEKLKR